MNSETKKCQKCKEEFTIEPDDFAFYESMKVPSPARCPSCRMIRRMGWHGERILYKRDCDFTKESVITFYHPDSPHKIYKQEIWWSDKWDPKSYGQDYDFSKPFFDQWGKLFAKVPLPA
ncbi:MAG: zinc-ribbon domain containing protein, partial [Candidatus Roizmanbacteria bacterium]|nr:zinc-ribbon domain containing protein [Candidatus Roizmanbacteria bacterium]